MPVAKKPAPVEASQKEIAQKEPAKEQEAIQPPPKQLTPLEKEILNLEKKVREIEKLKEMKASGVTLEKKQEEKIERAGEIASKLAQLSSEKFIEEQKNKPVDDVKTPQKEAMDIPTAELQAPQKKRANKKKAKSSHIPVVVPPRVQTQSATQSQMDQMVPPGTWEPVVELPMEFAVQQEDFDIEVEECEDFEMTPLGVPESWGCQFPAHLEPFNLAPQFDAALDDSVCKATTNQPERKVLKDDCWEWVTKGMCPRGEYCRWNHRPLGNGAGESSVFALNLGDESDSD